ncbi:MAG TPA: type III-A CRISPR-associated RAMP protein Csm3 [Anaerolineaceae bacterium]|nr:type III-A CRISPR-associated RAMP protein Csm3 [Anaerolineaceae bacterium]
MANPKITLKGRVFIRFDIKAVTGLHIGGSDTGIEIGGVDKTVIRDRLTNQPYIPGSSLRGKMRSLLEKYRGLEQNQTIGQGRIHSCGANARGKELEEAARQEYKKCDVCQVFGVPGERSFSTPTRLVARDVKLSDETKEQLEKKEIHTDLPYTEVKTEVSIDRVTSAANPRQMERVPAGAFFGPAELVYSLYDGDDCVLANDIKRLATVVQGLQLLEDDYLGGGGSRGSGKVEIKNIQIFFRKDPLQAEVSLGEYDSVNALASSLTSMTDEITRLAA